MGLWRLLGGSGTVGTNETLCGLYYPPPGRVVGGFLGNATLKLRQYPRIREYQVLSRVFIGQRPLIGPM
jgi:hypothetical protein